jgi:transcriptional regulator with GAF, ATPase, and Fis domain
MIRLGAKSHLSVPVSVGGSLWGAIVMVTVRAYRNWPEEVIHRFRLLGEIFANALKRMETEQELQRAFSQIKHLKEQIEAENIYLREEIKDEHNFEEIVGKSDRLKYVLFKVEQVAPTDSTVLILGETGTGKELVARAIHNESGRKNRPLIKVSCATLPSSLIESELFGHEKGAYTGAVTERKGRFELADGATIFLDEIGELPLELQPKLLRILQDGEFERLGGDRTIKTNVRIIAATNRDLHLEVQEGRFRQDLWYRINIFPITVPPLRKRGDDIPLMIHFFVNRFCKKLGKQIKTIPSSTMETLQKYSWPGNIRELEHMIERAVINTQGSVLQLMDKFENMDTGLMKMEAKPLVEIEREYIVKILQNTGGRVSGPKGAALILGLHPETLRSRMRKLGIEKSNYLS